MVDPDTLAALRAGIISMKTAMDELLESIRRLNRRWNMPQLTPEEWNKLSDAEKIYRLKDGTHIMVPGWTAKFTMQIVGGVETTPAEEATWSQLIPASQYVLEHDLDFVNKYKAIL